MYTARHCAFLNIFVLQLAVIRGLLNVHCECVVTSVSCWVPYGSFVIS